MSKKKLLIINRSFWPIYPVIGEALLRFAEVNSEKYDVGVILQDHVGIRKQLSDSERGKNVKFYPCKAWTASGSNVFRRILDAVFFMAWVFWVLIFVRPEKIYVSTDPPVLVPFIVAVYSKIFKAKYFYHLQDIHPEAANIVVKINPLIYKFLKKIDSFSIRNAELIITITDEMANEIRNRSGFNKKIAILPNPSIDFDGVLEKKDREKGFAFCGNAGRLQRIPLLILAIDKYIREGGILKFVFAGAGVYANSLREISEKYQNQVFYLGLVSSSKAAELNLEYEWALLPIEDEVTRFAFPSKSSSYALSGARIAAICSERTSVAKWVESNNLGVVVHPSVEALCDFFSSVENGVFDREEFSVNRVKLKHDLSFNKFIKSLNILICDEKDV